MRQQQLLAHSSIPEVLQVYDSGRLSLRDFRINGWLRVFWAVFAVYPAELYEFALQDIQLTALIIRWFRLGSVPDQTDA